MNNMSGPCDNCHETRSLRAVLASDLDLVPAGFWCDECIRAQPTEGEPKLFNTEPVEMPPSYWHNK